MTRSLPLALALALVAGACNNDDPSGTNTVPPTTNPDPSGLLLIAPNDPGGVVLPVAEDFDFYASAQFTLDHVQAGADGVTYADDPSVICTAGCETLEYDSSGVTMHPVDNAYGLIVKDFSNPVVRERDGVYDDGWVGVIKDDGGNPMGLAISNRETDVFTVPNLMGTWCSGLHGEPVKCSTEHYVTMEHIKTCHETIPYYYCDPDTGESLPEWDACEPLDDGLDRAIEDLNPSETELEEIAVGPDYAVSRKDDGKPLYRWGDLMKEPTDMRVLMRLPLPEEWAERDQEYRVVRAELAIVHSTANSPNDQIRPEDHENEGATGRTPAYTVESNGQWLSAVDCYEGDGTFIPAGTVFKNPDWGDGDAASEDLREGFTNAWYRTLDRDPFVWDTETGASPRWRLMAPKMGQDLPGFDIPIDNCMPAPLQNGEKKYETGLLTTTHLNLLDFGDEEAPLATSRGWMEPDGQVMISDDMTENGVVLTDDFELAVYVKGEHKAMDLYSAHLYIDFEPL